jgi:molecular chaperone DnaK (HSP70)
MEKRYVLGIDLGTSNSAISMARADQPGVDVLDVTQLFSAGAVGEKNILPSVMYLPAAGEFAGDSIGLPWDNADAARDTVLGALAKDRAQAAPDRVIASAKSWLCNDQVDRKGPILPWASSSERKFSPFEVSTRYLEHLKHSFLYGSAGEIDLAECSVVLTVPASFDEVARTLTYEAAEAAGFGQPTLLEEPQAAFYSWIESKGEKWREEVEPGDIVLICDVGGGTADFSLIAVSEKDGDLELERISVGDHILLGGDNMDLALAFVLRHELEQRGQNIDGWQFSSLVHASRLAKERLLSDDSLDQIPISVPSRGSGLFAQTITTVLKRETLNAVVLDGFFPLTAVTDLPHERKSVGLQEYGLPFASDPVISKHLAKFLVRSLKNVRSDASLTERIGEERLAQHGQCLRPSAVLFNGGVFNASILQKRVLELLASWNDGQEVKNLTSASLDLAVSRGAASYGAIALSGKGLRIRAGTARSYYLGLETSMPAVPGFTPPIKGLCVVPQGTEEGSQLLLEEQEFGLVTGETVEFRFFSSSVRAGDEFGFVVDDAVKDLEETARLEATLPVVNDRPGEVIPVRLSSDVTEMGTLELWMNHVHSDLRWKLEFNVRAGR